MTFPDVDPRLPGIAQAPPGGPQRAPGGSWAVRAGRGLAWALRRVLAVAVVCVLGPVLTVLMLWYALRHGSPFGRGSRVTL